MALASYQTETLPIGQGWRLTELSSWVQLKRHYESVKSIHLRDLFVEDENRFAKYSFEVSGILFDFSKHRMTDETFKLLMHLAKEVELPRAIDALFTGGEVNKTEQLPALHVALRNVSARPIKVRGQDVMGDIKAAMAQMEAICHDIDDKKWRGCTGKAITDVVHIGVGGNHFGPKLAVEALRPYWKENLNVHFVANIDGADILNVLKNLSPETTLFTVASKSFATTETLENARFAKQWYFENGGTEAKFHKHFLAMTANAEAAIHFGMPEKNILPVWDWVGGRYSLWSTMGLPVALQIGIGHFRELLEGANQMDRMLQSTSFERNPVIIAALLNVWYTNFFETRAHAIFPYEQGLALMPEHLQQLEMESTAKRVTQTGEVTDYFTSPVVWGGVGAHAQNAFHQILHQGTQLIPVDFILPAFAHHTLDSHQQHLVASCLSQSESLMHGLNKKEIQAELVEKQVSEGRITHLMAHKEVLGNHPSTTILFDKTTPKTLGTLLAFYEHKVYAQSVIWNLNAFDQWSAELSQSSEKRLFNTLSNDAGWEHHDGSTIGLLNYYKKLSQKF